MFLLATGEPIGLLRGLQLDRVGRKLPLLLASNAVADRPQILVGASEVLALGRHPDDVRLVWVIVAHGGSLVRSVGLSRHTVAALVPLPLDELDCAVAAASSNDVHCLTRLEPDALCLLRGLGGFDKELVLVVSRGLQLVVVLANQGALPLEGLVFGLERAGIGVCVRIESVVRLGAPGYLVGESILLCDAVQVRQCAANAYRLSRRRAGCLSLERRLASCLGGSRGESSQQTYPSFASGRGGIWGRSGCGFAPGAARSDP